MVHEALVIPVDVLVPVRVVEYSRPRDLLDLLYREIGCDYVDATPELPSRHGSFVLWLDDVGLLKQPVEHNDRAIALCRAVGYAVADLAGTAVVTGGAEGSGGTRTIPAALRDHLVSIFQPVPGELADTEAAERASALGGRRAPHLRTADQRPRHDLGRSKGCPDRDARGGFAPPSGPASGRGHAPEQRFLAFAPEVSTGLDGEGLLQELGVALADALQRIDWFGGCHLLPSGFSW
jgi:hypothetical protein